MRNSVAMASRKKTQPAAQTATPETPTEAEPESKKLTDTTNYANNLQMKGDKEKLKQHAAYVKEHERRIRQLQREARGIFVPGDHDGGY